MGSVISFLSFTGFWTSDIPMPRCWKISVDHLPAVAELPQPDNWAEPVLHWPQQLPRLKDPAAELMEQLFYSVLVRGKVAR